MCDRISNLSADWQAESPSPQSEENTTTPSLPPSTASSTSREDADQPLQKGVQTVPLTQKRASATPKQTFASTVAGVSPNDAAKTAATVALVAAVGIGILNMVLLATLRDYIPRLFTNEEDVASLVSSLLPLCAAFQLFDALAANCNGILRGIGRQEIGGIIGIIAYYAIGLPVSFGTGFGLGWDLYGLWAGPAVALFV